MTSPYHILFLTSNLGGGGAERALVNIINHLDRTRFQPHLALFQKQGVFVQDLAPDVLVYEIQPIDHGFLHRSWVRLKAIRDLVQNIRPSLIMSTKWQANAIAGLADKLWNFDIGLVMNEQSTPQSSLETDARRRRMWPVAKRLYRQADLIITISEGIAHELESTAQIEPNKMKVIHNPIELPINEEDPIILPGNKNSDTLIILAAGRLTPLKNFPMLLKASALVSQEHQIELLILGDGPERQHLDDLSRKLNISSQVHFMGFVSNPQNYFAQADIFTLTSNHEGFGNVIVEAMAMGVPVIATDCPYGPREILQGGKSGILVPVDDENALAGAILDLLDQPDKLEHLARAGKSRARDFSIQEILPQYEQAFLKLIEQ